MTNGPDPASEDTAAVSPASHALGSVLGQPSPSWALSHTKPTQLACPPPAGHLWGRPPETITIGPKRAEQPDQKPPSPSSHSRPRPNCLETPGRFRRGPAWDPLWGRPPLVRPLAPSSPPSQSYWVFPPILPLTPQLQMRKLTYKLCLSWFRQRRC